MKGKEFISEVNIPEANEESINSRIQNGKGQ